MILRYPGFVPPGQGPTVKHVYAEEEFRKENPKCKGCPYGNRQHCVGICWKDVYAPYQRKKKTVIVTEIAEITEENEL